VKDERQYLQEAFNSLEDAIVVVDEKHEIIIKNSKFQSNFGDETQDSIGENILNMIRSSDVMESLEKVIKGSKSIDFEFEFLYKQEKQFYYCKIQPIEHYERNLFLLFFRDITKIKKLEAIRRDFVANVSHEMKTPISSLIGYTETLLDHPEIKDEQKDRYLKRSLIQAKKMQALVTGLLQLSELEQGKGIEHSSFSLKTFLEEVVSINLVKTNKKQQNLVIELHDPEIIIQADRKQITIVMDNLLQNAISYAPEKGKIKIYSTELDENKISIFVQDDGAGIESKYIDRIFQRFYRVDNSRETHKTGTGLGLSIVKHIVEAHGQHVGVDSVPNEGSTFWFTLNRF
jgi:two-component system, OmpR family, phosphate regulon sensor histidine kinase PhoR